MSQLFTNNGSSLLVEDLLVADTTVNLAPGEGDQFPLPDPGDDDSFAMLTLEDVGGNFEVSVYDALGIEVPNALVTSQYVGQTLEVHVTDLNTNNSCWGYLVIEDKLPPTIECPDPADPLSQQRARPHANLAVFAGWSDRVRARSRP